jgi:DNA-binding winged helix-turn-helix (wHTH) protein
MSEPISSRRYRFGTFEADSATGELRRDGMRIKINAQPFQVLCLLLDRPGELLTRDEIACELWPDGTFVDYDHGVNSAVNRIREALGDSASNPRFVETLARRGYRFIAPVEHIGSEDSGAPRLNETCEMSANQSGDQPGEPSLRILSTPDELPRSPHHIVRTLFFLLQLMYLAFYISALANLAEIDELLAALPHPIEIYVTLIVTAALLIPVRAFLLTATVFQAPRLGRKFLRLWPALLLLDELWALSPFLLLHHINFGMALACTALLVYSPFAQRSLVLMGAAGEQSAVAANAG